MSLVSTMGAVMIGDLASAALYGLTTLQTILYFHKSWSSDSWSLKTYVALIWLLETTHMCMISSFLFHTLIIEYGNPAALLVTRVSDNITTLITGLIILSAHLFYVRRLCILSEANIYRTVLVGVVTTLAICHFGLTVAVMCLTFKFPAFSQFHKITGYYTGSMAVAAADDVLIALAMVHLLGVRRNGVRSTNALVDRFITLSIMSGALTSLVDLAILICFVAMPNNLIFLAMYNLVNNLYANSLLAVINSRDAIRHITKEPTTGFPFEDLRSTAPQLGRTFHGNSDDGQVSSKKPDTPVVDSEEL